MSVSYICLFFIFIPVLQLIIKCMCTYYIFALLFIALFMFGRKLKSEQIYLLLDCSQSLKYFVCKEMNIQYIRIMLQLLNILVSGCMYLPASHITVGLYLVHVVRECSTCNSSKLDFIFYAINWAHIVSNFVSPCSIEWLKLCFISWLHRVVSKPIIRTNYD